MDARTRAPGHSAGLAFDLAFHADPRGRSFVGRQLSRYPVHVGRGLHVDDSDPGACTLALQSVSGGLFEGERVDGRVVAHAGARAAVVTSASTIAHAMRGGDARQHVELRVHAGARLAYLPEALILFPGARVRTTTNAFVEPGALAVFCETFLAHDPAGGDRAFGELDARVEVMRADGGLLARERTLVDGGLWRAGHAGLCGALPVHAGAWIVDPGRGGRWLAPLREALAATGVRAGASELAGDAGVQVRALAGDAIAARRVVDAVLACVRGAPACAGGR